MAQRKTTAQSGATPKGVVKTGAGAGSKPPSRQKQHIESIAARFQDVLNEHGLNDVHVSRFALVSGTRSAIGHWEWVCDPVCHWVWVS